MHITFARVRRPSAAAFPSRPNPGPSVAGARDPTQQGEGTNGESSETETGQTGGQEDGREDGGQDTPGPPHGAEKTEKE